MEENATIRNGTIALAAGRSPWCLGTDRFFAEMWVASAPGVHAADCIRATRRARYLYNQNIQLSLFTRYCPNTKADFNTSAVGNVSYGGACGPPQISDRYNPLSLQILLHTKNDSACANIPLVVQRSFLWYGVPPVTYLAVMKSNLGPKRWDKYRNYDIYLNSSYKL